MLFAITTKRSPSAIRAKYCFFLFSNSLHHLHEFQEPIGLKDDWGEYKGIAYDYGSFVSVLRHCASKHDLVLGKKIHLHLANTDYRNNLFLGNLLIDMYGKCGMLQDARALFDTNEKNVFSWNMMIAAYVRHGDDQEAVDLFRIMQSQNIAPDKFTLSSIAGACSNAKYIEEGKRIHSIIISSGLESNLIVRNSLINMYGKGGNVDSARLLFDRGQSNSLISWTTMILAYSEQGHAHSAINLFKRMRCEGTEPDKVVFLSTLNACSNQMNITQGKVIHAGILCKGFESDVAMVSTLVDFYGKCGALNDAEAVFRRICNHNIVSSTAMTFAYVHCGQGMEALKVMHQMHEHGLSPDDVMLISVIHACSSLAVLASSKMVHASFVGIELQSNIILGNALIDMYCKSGNIHDACAVFDRMHLHDLVSWNTIIAAYSYNGFVKEALKLFQEMQLEGFRPNAVTFTSVISTTSYGGFVDKGHHYLVCMTTSYDIPPTTEHYGCIIDLLGRAGQVDEAEDFINIMPVQASVRTWTTLLDSCEFCSDIYP